MNIETVNFHEDPQKVIKDGFDCIWISFGKQRESSPLESKALQWVDWKLQGQISLFLLDKGFQKDKHPVTFLHTMGKMTVPYVVVESNESPDFEAIRNNCEGLKLKRVLIFCEEKERLRQFQESLKKLSWSEFPEFLTLGFEKTEERV